MAPDRGIDRLIDRFIPVGYSSLGYRLRHHLKPSPRFAPDVLAGRRVLVTGAAGGIGEAAALGLARLGASVHLLARSTERAEPAIGRIDEQLDGARRGALTAEACDVSDLSDVRRFAEGLSARLADQGAALDAIVHNAGVMPEHRTLTADGHELTVATHVLGPLLMTQLLRPALARSDFTARVIFVASGGMYAQHLHLDDPEYSAGKYRGAAAYARSKRMQVELAAPLSNLLASDRAVACAMHPGWVDTPGIAVALPGFSRLASGLLRNADQGAETIVWLVARTPPPDAGSFWHDRAERPRSYIRATRPSAAEVERLWRWAASASGIGTS